MNKCPKQNWDCDEDMPCSDCYWQENSINRGDGFVVKALMLSVVFIILMVFLVRFWDWQHKQIMSIEYCWDENGQHYVAPNPNCR